MRSCSLHLSSPSLPSLQRKRHLKSCGLTASPLSHHRASSSALLLHRPCLRRPLRCLSARPRPSVGCCVTSSAVSVGSIIQTNDSEIRWGSFVSEQVQLADAVDEAASTIFSSIGADSAPELALVFVSSTHEDEFEHVIPLLRKRLPSLKHIFGCSGAGVVGGSEGGPLELEGHRPAFSLTLGQLPGVELKIMHTLRSSIPKPDDTPQQWASFVGVPHDTPSNVSFVLLADPRFQQIRNIIAGLDFAFPQAPKIGGVLSSGPESKTRTMFAWSADGLVGTQRPAAAAPPPPPVSEPKPEEPKQAGQRPSLFQAVANFFGRWASGDKDANSGISVVDVIADVDSKGGVVEEEQEDEEQQGTFLHGAVALVLHGDVVLETIVSMGYRCPSNKTYRIDSTQSENAIATIVREFDSTYQSPSSSGDGSSSSSSSGGGPGSNTTGSGLLPRSSRMNSNDSDDDSDDDDDSGGDDDEGDELTRPVPAIAAIIELLDSIGEGARRDWEDILDTAVVALATDNNKLGDELQPDDFKIMALQEVIDDIGLLVVDGDVRRGHRVRIMIRDPIGVRNDLAAKLLAYKRQDLQAMMSGQTLPRTFGVLMFTDVTRGKSSYGESNYESQAIAGYLPVPASGMFGGAQVAHSSRGTSLSEQCCTIGVLRATGKQAARSPAVPPAPVQAVGVAEEAAGDDRIQQSSSGDDSPGAEAAAQGGPLAQQ